MGKILKRQHKNLFIFEAGYIWCKRRGIEYTDDGFIDDIFMAGDFECMSGSEFDNICKDLRSFRHFDSYNLIEISEKEYEDCVDFFN
jgi:hypothetical protein